MAWWVWLIIAAATIYLVGFIVVFGVHAIFLQMVTPGLALLRAAVWPIWFATGWPEGEPLPMD